MTLSSRSHRNFDQKRACQHTSIELSNRIAEDSNKIDNFCKMEQINIKIFPSKTKYTSTFDKDMWICMHAYTYAGMYTHMFIQTVMH